jgi:predicted RNase H-like nuclease (RuvC/YqgF family)
MKKMFFVLITVLFAVSVWAEDLGELAKKEKARREALAKEGKKGKVLTNKDVKDIKSSLGIESHTPVVEEPEQKSKEEPAAAVQEAVDQSNAELEELKQQKAELTQQVQEASDAIQQSGARSTNTGEQYREKRLKEEELRKVEEKIEELEKGRKETAEEPEAQN